MLTAQVSSVPTATYPAYRPYEVVVGRILPLSPHFVRVTFVGDDLQHFGTCGLDQRVKLVLPHPDGSLADLGARDPATLLAGSWYDRWRATSPEARNPLRTYTVRAVRPEGRELDVDLVRHPHGLDGADGPAAVWLRDAAVGDRLLVVGPDSRAPDPSVGLCWRPGSARHLLLVGDETAAPAICSIVESLAPEVTAQAFIEVPTGDDILTVHPRGRSRLTWLARDAGCVTADGWAPLAPHGFLLDRTVRTWVARHLSELSASIRPQPEPLTDVDPDAELLWDTPVDPADGDVYGWIAGEASMVRSMRRHLVTEIGMARSSVAFMGYWRRGRSERT